MPRRVSAVRRRDFEANLLLWGAVHHFLPANLLREMCLALCSAVAPDSPKLEDLFEEICPGEDPTATWVLRPKSVGDEPSRYLQGRILALVWRNDAGRQLERESGDVVGAAPVKAFEVALQVGRLDFGKLAAVDAREIPDDSGLAMLWAAIRDLASFAQQGHELDPQAILRPQSMTMPLHAIVLKHLGDLCADSDRWDYALAFYRSAGARIAAFSRARLADSRRFAFSDGRPV